MREIIKSDARSDDCDRVTILMCHVYVFIYVVHVYDYTYTSCAYIQACMRRERI